MSSPPGRNGGSNDRQTTRSNRLVGEQHDSATDSGSEASDSTLASDGNHTTTVERDVDTADSKKSEFGTTSSGDVRITIRDVAHSFGETEVLTGVDLTVRDGELVGLVGPNGAGKSTLLRIAAGAFVPDSGTVRLNGDRVSDLDSRAVSRRLAVVPQSTNLSFSFSVHQIVEMGRHPHRGRFGAPTGMEQVEAAMQRTEVTALADRRIDEVSGGERQRVLLARAIAQDAPALALDEPTANLDVNHRIETLETVRSFVDDGKAVLAAIHDLDLAARYCDRIALLENGSIVECGPPVEVLTSGRIGATFDIDAAVWHDHVTDAPRVTALSHRDRDRGRVHVLGHCRATATIIGRLADDGWSVTAGPVPPGGAVATVADAVGQRVITAPPYESLDQETLTAVQESVDTADIVIVHADGLSDGFEPALATTAGADPVVVVGNQPEGLSEDAIPVEDSDLRSVLDELS